MQALWMVLGAFLFATMAVCLKVASAWFNSSELLFWRGLVGLALLALIARHRGINLGTRYPGMHLWRSMVGVVALWTWFFALAYLPVSTAMTLNYMSGIWVAAFVIGGGMLAGSQAQGRDFLRQQGPLAMSVLAGFGGVILILQPTMATEQFLAALLGLMSGMAAALAFVQVSAMTRIGEPETRIVFYFALGSTLAGALGMTAQGVSPWRWEHALWLLPIGLLASLGQLCMTYAYGSGATLLVTCLQYSGIVFATLYAVLLFGEQIPPVGWIGMGLIVASGDHRHHLACPGGAERTARGALSVTPGGCSHLS